MQGTDGFIAGGVGWICGVALVLLSSICKRLMQVMIGISSQPFAVFQW